MAFMRCISAGRRRPIAFLCLLAGLVFLPENAARADVKAAEQFVNETAEQVIRILTTAKTRQEREARFSALLDERADLRRMGRFALGMFARRISKDDFAVYQGLLEVMIVKVYANRLGDYSNEKIVIRNSIQKKRNVIVESDIVFTAKREPIPLDWWLLEQKEGGYKLFDVRVLGVWMVQEQRDAFTSVLKNNNGDIQALLDHLREQVSEELAQNEGQHKGQDKGQGKAQQMTGETARPVADTSGMNR